MADPFDPYHRWLGIPPTDQPPNHYRLLGLQLFERDLDVIDSAADQRMAHLRTFQTGQHSSLSQKLLNEVAAAKVCLLNPQKRTAYNRLLQQELSARAADAPKHPVAERVEPDLAVFAARADRDSPVARSRATARIKPARIGIIVGAAVAGGLLILGLILWGGPSGESPSTVQTALVFDWPEDQRNGALLQIDGLPFVVESSGPLQHGCPPGQHRIVAARPGFQPFVETVTLQQGQTKTVRPVWEAVKEGPPLPVDPVAGTDKPAETPPGGTASRGGTSAPPAGPGDGSPPQQPADEPPKAAVDPGVSDPQQPPTPVGQQRLPVPTAEAQQQVAARLDEVYKLSALKTPQQKLQSAGELLDLGKRSKENPAERFVLLRSAGELARDGGDAALMLEIIEAIAADYDVDVLSLKQDFLTKFARAATSSQRIGSLVESSLPLVDEALAEGRYDLALKLIDAAYRASTRSAGKEHRKRVYDRRGEVQKLHRVWKEYQDALTTLKTAPDDAAADLIVAQWYCFKQGDWEQGLPYLAKGSDEALKTVAQQELTSPPADPAAQIKLADAWWNLAEKHDGVPKQLARSRATIWYSKGLPQLAGLEKLRVEKRLDELEKARAARLYGQPESGGQRVEGMAHTLPTGVVVYCPMDAPLRRPPGAFPVFGGTRRAYGMFAGARQTNGVLGKGLMFDGQAAGVMQLPPSADKWPGLTVCTWFRLDRLKGTSGGPARLIARSFATAKNEGPGFEIQAYCRGDIEFLAKSRVDDSGWVKCGGMTEGKWTHVALASDERGSAIYVDGRKSAETKVPARPPVPLIETGREHTGTGLAISVDEFMVFARRLSEEEIKRLRQTALDGIPFTTVK